MTLSPTTGPRFGTNSAEDPEPTGDDGVKSRVAALPPLRQAALRELLAARARRTSAIPPRPHPGEPAPCSPEQRQMWLAAQLRDALPAPNATLGLRLDGPLDRAALSEAIDTLVARHEILRTVYEDRDGEPWQVVRPAAPVPLDVADLTGMPEEDREEHARAVTARAVVERFDLTTGPVFRFTLIRLADESHVLLFVCHHIACDGWSVGVVVDELAAVYTEKVTGKATERHGGQDRESSALPPLPIQYADYAAWSRRELTPREHERRLAHWRERLNGATDVWLPMAADREPEEGGLACGTHRFALPAGMLRKLQEAGGPGTTPFVALLTIFSMLLSRYTDSHDLTIGSVHGGRRRAELEPLIGYFITPFRCAWTCRASRPSPRSPPGCAGRWARASPTTCRSRSWWRAR